MTIGPLKRLSNSKADAAGNDRRIDSESEYDRQNGGEVEAVNQSHDAREKSKCCRCPSLLPRSKM